MFDSGSGESKIMKCTLPGCGPGAEYKVLPAATGSTVMAIPFPSCGGGTPE